jgi:agmatinase
MKNYHNFLNIPLKYSGFKKAKVVIVPFPYEKTATWGKGTKFGPKAIINASFALEFFDEELKAETYKKVGIHTAGEINLMPIQHSVMRGKTKNFYLPLVKKLKEIIAVNKFPIILGGEHSITLESILGLTERYKSFSVLHFDAHSDLRDNYDGKKFSHACIMRRILEQKEVKNLVQVGIRNISNDQKEGREFDFYQKNKNRIKIFWAWEMKKWKIAEIVKSLKEKNVFISFDVDVFDSGIMPSTGTPEPGGIDFYQALDILKRVFWQKNVIGCDILELAPIKDFPAPDFMTAKLVYKMIGYKFLL